MMSLPAVAVLLLAVASSLAFPRRPMASYEDQAATPVVGYYVMPVQGSGRMGSFPQFGSPYGFQQPQFVLLNPANFAQYYPAQTRSDNQGQEATNEQNNSENVQGVSKKNPGMESNPQELSAKMFPSPAPVFVLMNQAPQMGYYDLMNPGYSNYMSNPQEPVSRMGTVGHNNFVGFRPASHYRARSQKPLVSLSYPYPNLFTRQQSYDGEGYDDVEGEGVVVEAMRMRHAQAQAEKGEKVDSERVEAAEPAGPSVAQSKPQAIAMAGPGGVAAATPMATAVVGPGGMAVAAPSATAVAGPSGGKPPVSIGSNAAVNAAYKAQQKAERKQEQFGAVSLGGKLVAPIGARARHSDGLLAYAV